MRLLHQRSWVRHKSSMVLVFFFLSKENSDALAATPLAASEKRATSSKSRDSLPKLLPSQTATVRLKNTPKRLLGLRYVGLHSVQKINKVIQHEGRRKGVGGQKGQGLLMRLSCSCIRPGTGWTRPRAIFVEDDAFTTKIFLQRHLRRLEKKASTRQTPS